MNSHKESYNSKEIVEKTKTGPELKRIIQAFVD
jgi:hypothetical protein